MLTIASAQRTWFSLRLIALASLVLLGGCVNQRQSGTVPPTSAALTTQAPQMNTTATRLPDITPSPSAARTATPPPANLADPLIVVIDTAIIREGPGVSFPIAEAGNAQAAYGSMLTFDLVIAGDAVAGDPWWGHLISGLGFVSMTAVRSIGFVSAGEAATPPEDGQYIVAIDGVFVREGPGLSFPVALGGLAQEGYFATLDVDAVAQGEPLAGNPWWGHLADGRGFVSFVALQPVAPLPTMLPSTPAQPTAETTVPSDTPGPTATKTLLGGLPHEGVDVIKPPLTTLPPPPIPGAPSIDVQPSQGNGPTRFTISLINFPAGRAYSLNFYRWYDHYAHEGCQQGCHVYISQDTTEPTNDQGQTDYYLQTSADDYSGRYLVRVIEEVDEKTYFAKAEFSVKGLPIPPTLTPAVNITITPTITPTTAITLTDTPTVTLTPTISVTLVATIDLPPSVTATPSVELTKPVEVSTITPTPSVAAPVITALPTVTPVANIEPTLPTAPTTLLSATPLANVPASRGSTTHQIGPTPVLGKRLNAILWSHTKRHAVWA